jgi:hypothetical protein
MTHDELTPAQEDRIIQQMPMVHRVANDVLQTQPKFFLQYRDDLIGVGMSALVRMTRTCADPVNGFSSTVLRRVLVRAMMEELVRMQGLRRTPNKRRKPNAPKVHRYEVETVDMSTVEYLIEQESPLSISPMSDAEDPADTILHRIDLERMTAQLRRESRGTR